MSLQIIKGDADVRVPRSFVIWWQDQLMKWLVKEKVISSKQSEQELVFVFMNKDKAKKLNQQFRGKNYPTDVLSFSSVVDDELGELVFCMPVIKKQSAEHGLSMQFELGYMIIHGVLHLLGYKHENSETEAKKMFDLQDKVFDQLCDRWQRNKTL